MCDRADCKNKFSQSVVFPEDAMHLKTTFPKRQINKEKLIRLKNAVFDRTGRLKQQKFVWGSDDFARLGKFTLS